MIEREVSLPKGILIGNCTCSYIASVDGLEADRMVFAGVILLGALRMFQAADARSSTLR